MARFLDLGFPLAALLLNSEPRWPARLLALGYLPLGLVAVLLTASRGGFLAALVALAGCGILLLRSHAKAVLAGVFALPAHGGWALVRSFRMRRSSGWPRFQSRLQSGDLNQRLEYLVCGLARLCAGAAVGHAARARL